MKTKKQIEKDLHGLYDFRTEDGKGINITKLVNYCADLAGVEAETDEFDCEGSQEEDGDSDW